MKRKSLLWSNIIIIILTYCVTSVFFFPNGNRLPYIPLYACIHALFLKSHFTYVLGENRGPAQPERPKQSFSVHGVSGWLVPQRGHAEDVSHSVLFYLILYHLFSTWQHSSPSVSWECVMLHSHTHLRKEAWCWNHASPRIRFHWEASHGFNLLQWNLFLLFVRTECRSQSARAHVLSSDLRTVNVMKVSAWEGALQGCPVCEDIVPEAVLLRRFPKGLRGGSMGFVVVQRLQGSAGLMWAFWCLSLKKRGFLHSILAWLIF